MKKDEEKDTPKEEEKESHRKGYTDLAFIGSVIETIVSFFK